MADERAWADGYLAQARADLEAVERLQGRTPSVLAMLLQMAFEKLGKAALLRNRSLTVERAQATHKAASVLVGILRRRPDLGESFGFKHAGLWRRVLDFVVALEAATRNWPAPARSWSTRGQRRPAKCGGQRRTCRSFNDLPIAANASALRWSASRRASQTASTCSSPEPGTRRDVCGLCAETAERSKTEADEREKRKPV